MSLRPIIILLCLTLLAESLSASSPRRVAFDADAWMTAKVNELIVAARAAYENDDTLPDYQQVLTSIARTMASRRLSQDEGFAGRYRNFVDYIQAASLDQLPGHELGFEVPDKQYFAETRRFVQVPEFLMDQSFLRSVSRDETLDRAKAYLRRINLAREPSEQLLFFSYRSKHLGTPDNDESFERLLIVVPGKAETGVPEKWVQFGVTDPNDRILIRNLSVVSAVADSDGTFNTYFKDYFRTYRRRGPITIKGRWELGYGDDNCVTCHKSGLLPVFPLEGSVSSNELRTLAAVNKRFLTYGSPRFGGYLDESKFGPGFGSATRAAREKRFGAGFEGTDIGRAMVCANCHKDGQLGALNWPLDPVVVGSYIRGGQMPFGGKLEASRREELHQKLIEEYFAIDDDNPGILKSWLMGKSR